MATTPVVTPINTQLHPISTKVLKHREAVRRYALAHPEVIRNKKRSLEQGRKDAKLWRLRHPYSEFPSILKEKARKASREYYERNAEAQCAQHKIWLKNNRDKRNIQEHNRRARVLHNGGIFTHDEWLALCEKYSHACLRCTKHKKLTADHVVPLSKGGSNDITNIQPLCRTCNLQKATKSTDYRLKENSECLQSAMSAGI
jgi:5-methylcytosine-specific restriction endonuclease McrA